MTPAEERVVQILTQMIKKLESEFHGDVVSGELEKAICVKIDEKRLAVVKEAFSHLSTEDLHIALDLCRMNLLPTKNQ